MLAVFPKATLLIDDEDRIKHVANCASVCYGKEEAKNHSALYDNLISSSHLSMFRHETFYFAIDYTLHGANIKNFIARYSEGTPGVHVYHSHKSGYVYISMNGQFLIEHHEEVEEELWPMQVSKGNFIKYAIKNEDKEALTLVRFTFQLVTQISTSRELNRVSPNNISERSTRYCHNQELVLCLPYSFSQTDLANKHKLVGYFFNSELYELDVDLIDKGLSKYTNYIYDAFLSYKDLLEDGYNPEFARGVLPLDTATVVCYTYTLKEWVRLINLRYHGKYGKPHPNAKEIMGQVRDILLKEVCDWKLDL